MGDVRRLYGPDTRTDIFYVDSSGNLVQKWAPYGGPWSTGTLMTGCTANAEVEAAWLGSLLDVYAKGSSGVRHAWWTEGAGWQTQTL